MKSKTIVMYCTGGIRCEKASVVMMDAGFKDVRQLEGGILGYFEEVGGEHWNGDCFVFDQRVAVDPALQETEVTMCFRCWQSLSQEEQQSEHYEIGVSCPYCANKNAN
jgi:predicted sulfurtransferase